MHKRDCLTRANIAISTRQHRSEARPAQQPRAKGIRKNNAAPGRAAPSNGFQNVMHSQRNHFELPEKFRDDFSIEDEEDEKESRIHTYTCIQVSRSLCVAVSSDERAEKNSRTLSAPERVESQLTKSLHFEELRLFEIEFSRQRRSVGTVEPDSPHTYIHTYIFFSYLERHVQMTSFPIPT